MEGLRSLLAVILIAVRPGLLSQCLACRAKTACAEHHRPACIPSVPGLPRLQIRRRQEALVTRRDDQRAATSVCTDTALFPRVPEALRDGMPPLRDGDAVYQKNEGASGKGLRDGIDGTGTLIWAA